MAKTSAGLLLYRHGAAVDMAADDGNLEVLIVHPGGPFWARKHEGAWSVPKGEFDPVTENPRPTAAREFHEELGVEAPPEPWLELGETKLKSGKRILAWAVAGELDVDTIESNTFAMEWPRGSGRMIDVPEVDEARWCRPDEAVRLLNPAQAVFIERLIAQL